MLLVFVLNSIVIFSHLLQVNNARIFSLFASSLLHTFLLSVLLVILRPQNTDDLMTIYAFAVCISLFFVIFYYSKIMTIKEIFTVENRNINLAFESSALFKIQLFLEIITQIPILLLYFSDLKAELSIYLYSSNSYACRFVYMLSAGYT